MMALRALVHKQLPAVAAAALVTKTGVPGRREVSPRYPDLETRWPGLIWMDWHPGLWIVSSARAPVTHTRVTRESQQ